jgi:hypothetical protein
LSDDFNKLELYLQSGKSSSYWTQLEDCILKRLGDDSEEVKMLQEIKGPQEIVNRKFFLGIC